jgi:hypothetical protein
MITKFDKFKMFEGRGISDIIKQYSNIIYDYFSDGEDKILLDFDYEQLPLIDLRIIFTKSDINNGTYDLDNSFFDSGKLHQLLISIKYNNIDKNFILGLINHELNHINEYYNIHNKMNKMNIKIKPTWIDIQLSYKSLNISNSSPYYKFIYLLYLSLDTEMNARITQVYEYLLSFNSTNFDYLYTKLKEHQNWKYLEMLNNFDYENFVDENIELIELTGLLKITNDLIEKFKDKDLNKRTKSLSFIKDSVSDIINLYNFYDNFSKYFKKKCVKHITHMEYIIKEVIEELNGNRPFNEALRTDKK